MNIEQQTSCLIFGASKKGEMALAALAGRCSVVGFIDNAEVKWGSEFAGLPVYSLSQALKVYPTTAIVIASQYQIEMIEQLLALPVYQFFVYAAPYRPQDFAQDSFFYFDLREHRGQSKHQVALLIHNFSGSNTLALAKSGYLQAAGVPVSFAYSFRRDQGYIETLFSSQVVVSTHEMITRPGTRYLQLWHGFPLKGLNLMSTAQTEVSRQRVQASWQRYDAVASYSTLYRTLMNACYGMPVERYQLTGMPRNDLLFQSGAVERLKALLPATMPDAEHYLFYIPTFRKTRYGQVNGDADLGLFGFSEIDLQRLQDFLYQQNAVLVVKPHPYHETELLEQLSYTPWLDRVVALNDSHLINAELDFYQILAAADVLITDYSSVYFDFLLLDKPIVFTPSDLDTYRGSRGFLLEPYDFWAPGVKVFNQADWEQAMVRALLEPQADAAARATITDMVHHFRDDESSRRVGELVLRLLDQ